jgi:hypothetical protein
MSFLDRLLGRTPAPTGPQQPSRTGQPPDPDQVAVERYRYLLRTAPPDELERAHVEAFERLTPEQRAIARRDLEAAVAANEAPATDEPQDLARAATRAELRQPGTLERTFGASQGPGMAGSFLNTFAAVFVATSMAQLLFGSFGDPSADAAADPTAADATEADAGAADPADASSDVGDFGGFGTDIGGDFGDFGGFEI